LDVVLNSDDNLAKFKLCLGLNLKTYKLYAKLRFRTEPVSPFDFGDGISWAGKVPLPLYLVPWIRSVPLRVEYRVCIHTSRPGTLTKNHDPHKRLFVNTGVGSIDLSLDELNFCLEWDERSPVRVIVNSVDYN
jgi:hypothetical protein